jgi:ABC-type antimicrobial peptide transport system permease subunit
VGRETNRQRRERQAASARDKAAAARAVAQRQEQRRRAVRILSSIGVVAVVGIIIAVVAITSGGKKNTLSGNRAPATPAVVKGLTTVKPSVYLPVGAGDAAQAAKAASDPPLTNNGKPEVLYVGGEFCPYCAATRWSLIQALSRFGKFSNLSFVSSSSSDVYPNTPTFSFYNSTYTSKYVSFVPVENEDRDQKTLESLTSAQAALFSKYTNGFPFVDFGGKFVQTSPAFSPQDLDGMTQPQIVSQLSDPNSKPAKDILGEANTVTAMICTLTTNQPSSVCQQPQITNLQSQLNG